ncbi:MAG: hypothetical protein AVDCRST_MAG05-4259 [uncultured Rubrobacteraceae bacterium]|uniref:Uncharacterized protein n=1 Tax=uncultured Rubrobacteraceae bacterium TaxID=349277 RepID=A0A6J4TPL4_9ACTN|nr:MAG: hypothetical protein AVDCRST_MAG05-4259 [uncultured Rubrobacteraceae bacterium]
MASLTVASGWFWRSQRVMVTTGLTISAAEVSGPSPVSFSAYIWGSLVGLLERRKTRRSSSRSLRTRRLAPGSSSSPRYMVPSRSKT